MLKPTFCSAQNNWVATFQAQLALQAAHSRPGLTDFPAVNHPIAHLTDHQAGLTARLNSRYIRSILLPVKQPLRRKSSLCSSGSL